MTSQWSVSADTTTCLPTIGEQMASAVIKLTSISENGSQELHICSTSVGSFKGLSVDEQLALLSDQCLCSAQFGSAIDEFSILAGGYVAVAESSGLVSLGVVVEERLVMQHSFKLSSPNTEGRAFSRLMLKLESDQDNDQEEMRALMIALQTDGCIVVGRNIVLQKENIDVSQAKMSQIKASARTIDIAMEGDDIVTVGPGGVELFSLDHGQLVMSSGLDEIDCQFAMSRVHMIADTSFFITMDTSGVFYLWDSLTLTVFYTWSIPGALDFRHVVSDLTGVFGLSKLRLVVLKDNQTIEVVALPTLECHHRYDVPSKQSGLTRAPQDQDDVFAADISTMEDFLEVETTVSLKHYAEASPEKRLRQLLSRCRFEEAEALAKLYGIPLKFEASMIQRQLHVAKETYTQQEAHLQWCHRLLDKMDEQATRELVLRELRQVELRLKAFKIVFGEDLYSAEEWLSFLFENTLKLSYKLASFNPDKVFALWGCLQVELGAELTPVVVDKMLSSLSDCVMPEAVVQWLSDHVIPTQSGSDPDTVRSVTEWWERQLYMMERKGETGWIDRASELTSTLVDNFDTTEVPQTSMEPLLQDMKDLHELKTLGGTIPLQVLKQETKEGLVFYMLSRVGVVDQLPATLRTTVQPYIRRHKLVADKVFVNCIERFVQQQSRQTRGGWEDMLIAIIDVIKNAKEKVTAVMKLVQHVDLPLPEFVASVVEETLASINHPQCQCLSEQWAVKEASHILKLRGINASEIVSSLDALNAAKHLVKAGAPISQAQKVLSAFSSHRHVELFEFVCQLKVERGQIKELLDFIDTLPQKMAKKCCQFVMGMAKLLTSEGMEPKVAESLQNLHMRYYEAALCVAPVMRAATNDYFLLDGINKESSLIKKMRDMQTRYGMSVSGDALSDRQKCRSLLADAGKTGRDIISLSRLLDLQGCDVVQVLLSSKMADTYMDKIISLLCDTLNDVELPASAVSDLVSELTVDSGEGLLDVLARVAVEVFKNCSPDELTKKTSVCTVITFLQDISKLQKKPNAEPCLQMDDILEKLTNIVCSVVEEDMETKNEEEMKTDIEFIIEELTLNRHREKALRVVNFLPTIFSDLPFAKDYASFVQSHKNNLLIEQIQEMLSSDTDRIQDALPYVLDLPRQELIVLMTSIIQELTQRADYTRLKHVSSLASACAEVIREANLTESCNNIKVIAKWGEWLANMEIPFTVDDKLEALDKLAMSPHCTFELIMEFCRDFHIQYFCRACSTFVPHLMARDPEMQEHTQREAHNALHKIMEPLHLLKQLVMQTSPYKYEHLRFLLSEIDAREHRPETKTGLALLRYLDKYTRRCVPPPEERKYWSDLCIETAVTSPLDCTGIELDITCNESFFGNQPPSTPEKDADLPSASKTRLPYHMVMNKTMEVINKEITAETLDLWISIGKLIDIPKDTVLIKTVVNSLQMYTSSTEASKQPASSAFVSFLEKSRQLMISLSKPEMALWCCYSIKDKLEHVEEKRLAFIQFVELSSILLGQATEEMEKAKIQKAHSYFKRRLQASSMRPSNIE